jgi:hypothetical protein
LVRRWVEVENGVQASATALADEFLSRRELVVKSAKSKAPYANCLSCGGPLKRKHPKCKGCSAPNPTYGGEPVSKKRKAFKAQARTNMLTKASGSRWPVTTTHQAVTCMLMDLANDPDPGTRLAAKAELRKRAG